MPGKRVQEERPAERKRRRLSVHATSLAAVLDFHGVWRELKASGWTSKPPRGLDDRYRYVLPGRPANGKAGEDFLLGKEAVLQHFLINSKLQVCFTIFCPEHSIVDPVPSSIESNNAEDGERATTVRIGGAGADGELVLQVATVASATEDVTKELEAASKTVSALLRYE
ncbi:hypothetical protein DVH05_018817 [Phytophthora capsici]|nr:hypothetical protein DVH05_018817 [Phytophthora capsici]